MRRNDNNTQSSPHSPCASTRPTSSGITRFRRISGAGVTLDILRSPPGVDRFYLLRDLESGLYEDLITGRCYSFHQITGDTNEVVITSRQPPPVIPPGFLLVARDGVSPGMTQAQSMTSQSFGPPNRSQMRADIHNANALRAGELLFSGRESAFELDDCPGCLSGRCFIHSPEGISVTSTRGREEATGVWGERRLGYHRIMEGHLRTTS